MKTGPKGIALIKAHEGKRLTAYLCPANVLTIGYGHTSAAGDPRVTKGKKISEAEADVILVRDLATFERGVSRMVKSPLTQGQFDALVSFAFNCGLGALQNSSLLRKLNAGRHQDVPAELMKWTRGGGRELPGLVRRRREEAALWRDVSTVATAGKADVVAVDVPKEAPRNDAIGLKSRTAQGTTVAGTGGLVVAGGAIADAADTLRNAEGHISAGTWIGIAIGALIIAGAGYAFYARWQDGGGQWPWEKK